MNTYNPDKHHRRSIRLKGYDYGQAGLYFITICCKNRVCLFGEIINGKMTLNAYGHIAYNEWMNTPEIRNNVELGEFIVMPNHIHGIIRILGRGELHSPRNLGNNDTTNIIQGECNSPQKMGGNDDPNNDLKGECNSPQTMGGNDDPNNDLKGECNSPQTIVGNDNPHNVILENRLQGECNSPLRSPSQTVGAIVRGYKSSVTKQLNLLEIGRTVWQRNYHERIIRDEKSYRNISNYIINNPAKWNEDNFYL